LTHLWTIGHSTTPIDEFLALLRGQSIGVVADIRSYPGSRHSPQFGKAELAKHLRRAGLEYVHIADLGGRRNAQDVDPRRNEGWRNRSFRNYADYALTPPFEAGLTTLTELADTSRTAYLCSEAVPWRCHRTIVSDVLVARGHEVTHVIGNQIKEHVLGAWGPEPHCDDGTVTYPGSAMSG
jgi:uncharacterized protein (DUF488 family)